jgi:hypothetical protein
LKKIKMIIPVMIASKIPRNKFNQGKTGKLNTVKPWLKKLKKTKINGKIVCAHWWKELTLLKCQTIQRNIQIQHNPIKILMVFFIEIRKPPKINMKP